MRKKGYYWIKGTEDSEWVPGEYTEDIRFPWTFMGSEVSYAENEIFQVGPKIELPEELK